MPAFPNLLFVFGDQWRAQACGYAGDPNVRTPNIDAFAAQSVNLRNAVSGYPVCSPYRASLLTGQYPLTHGMIVNDQRIRGNPASIADALNAAGYDTAYIGKWHVHGPRRSAFIPPEDRMGFKHWLGFECTHDESILIPFLLRWPASLGMEAREVKSPLNSPDVMPTMLGLCGAPIPDSVEGCDFSPTILGEDEVDDGGAYLACYCPFHQIKYNTGGRDFRGLRTVRYTYVRDHLGPWLLFDNEADPYQMYNLAQNENLCAEFEAMLQRKLKKLNDPFALGCQLLRKFNVRMNEEWGDMHYEW